MPPDKYLYFLAKLTWSVQSIIGATDSRRSIEAAFFSGEVTDF